MTRPDLRTYLASHPPRAIAMLAQGPLGSATESNDHEIAHTLACHCGSREFRLLGVAAAMAPEAARAETVRHNDRAGGRYVLRSMLRLWRELRMTTGQEAEQPALVAPIVLDCARCSARHELLVADAAAGSASVPLEAYRCRPCRRTIFGVSVLHDYAALDFAEAAQIGDEERFEGWCVRARCRACGRTAEPVRHCIRNAQQRTLDSLYGREGRGGVESQDEPHT